MTQLPPILSNWSVLEQRVDFQIRTSFPLKLSLLVILSTSLNSYNGILLSRQRVDPVPSPSLVVSPPPRPSWLLVLSLSMLLSFGTLSQLNSDLLSPSACPCLTSSLLSRLISSLQPTKTWLRTSSLPEPLYSDYKFLTLP